MSQPQKTRANALRGAWGDLAQRLTGTRAKTVDGIIAKLAMVATDMVCEEDLEGADYDSIAASAALDAVRLREKLGLYPVDHRPTKV